MTVGGDITEISYNHPTLGSGTLFPKAGEDNTYDLGGFRSKDDANGIDGGGQPIDVMNRVRGFFECSVANDMNTNKELEAVSALAASPVAATWTFSVVNGKSYTGTGKPVGDLSANINQGTFKMKVSGGAFAQV